MHLSCAALAQIDACRPCNPKVRSSNLGTDLNFEKVSRDMSDQY